MYHPSSFLQDWILYINDDYDYDDSDYNNDFDIESQEYVILQQNIDRTSYNTNDVDDWICPITVLTVGVFWIYLYIGLSQYSS